MYGNYATKITVLCTLTTVHTTVRRKNFTVIKFYGLPLNHLDEILTDFNFTEVKFCARGQQYIVDSIQFTDFNFTVSSLTIKP